MEKEKTTSALLLWRIDHWWSPPSSSHWQLNVFSICIHYTYFIYLFLWIIQFVTYCAHWALSIVDKQVEQPGGGGSWLTGVLKMIKKGLDPQREEMKPKTRIRLIVVKKFPFRSVGVSSFIFFSLNLCRTLGSLPIESPHRSRINHLHEEKEERNNKRKEFFLKREKKKVFDLELRSYLGNAVCMFNDFKWLIARRMVSFFFVGKKFL